MSTPDILQKIIATKRDEVRDRKRRMGDRELAARIDAVGPTRGFARALSGRITRRAPAVIAEIKRASPSKGLLRDPFDVIAIARSYAASQAACLSVLTDETYFQGSDEFLRMARAATTLPVLRKDFVVDPWQVAETRALGADCLLLIVSALAPTQLRDLYQQALEIDLDVLVEVHDREELGLALSLSPGMVGINNRNLHTFETSLDVTERLLQDVPDDVLVITESGIRVRADVDRMFGLGVYGFLVGEAFMVEADPGTTLDSLFA